MDLEYDRKFEEMKKYIPFLESMIKRLENTNKGVKNPRKAQLDKIRSLRDLLLDKKKRMKMENLLKCEQVLVNLYAKVEQRDSMTDTKEDCTEQNQKDISDLNIVRNKLKSVVSKLQDDVPETLPEIARATNMEVVCTPGSKEPALFQRRPNKALPPSESINSRNDDDSSSSNRHYTRVLMSPEHKKNEWLTSLETNIEKPLFSRRSPRKSPRRYSPSYKKERKKSSKQRSKSSQNSKDLNITLKVPEESLGSLNTKDILSRIINCSDSDVDIETLRGLRSQILGELKQTGTKDDISDLILKSYKKKENSSKKQDEVEEGELSDSESEAIENIYGSLVVVDQGEDDSDSNKILNDKKHPRKIQICLVINSDKEKVSKVNDKNSIQNSTLDVTDFEAYPESKSETETGKVTDKVMKGINRKENEKKDTGKETIEEKTEIPEKIEDGRKESPKKDTAKTESKGNKIEKLQDVTQNKSSTESFKPNFYQPFTEENITSEEFHKNQSSCKSSNAIDINKDEAISIPLEITKNTQAPNSRAKIKMKKDVVSEIDILQALKKEILGETTTAPVSQAITPALHQPKITKVASSQEIISKKRISIEKYKQKSVPIKQPLFNSLKQQSSLKDDNSKKQSLKLTEKECERFNFPVNVSPVDSSEDDDKMSLDSESLNEDIVPTSEYKNKKDCPKGFGFLHSDSVPKSPDHDDFADTGIRPPVIIPSDPVKNTVANAKADIDMRPLLPLLSPVGLEGSRRNITSPSITNENMLKATQSEKGKEKARKSTSDLMRTAKANDSPNSYLSESDRQSRATTGYPNVPCNISSNITSNIPPLMSLNVASIMTPTQNPSMNSGMTPILNSNIPLILNPSMAPNMPSTPGLLPNMNPTMTPSRMVTCHSMMTPILTPNARSYEMTPRSNFDNDEYKNQKHVYAPIFPTFELHDFSEKETSQVNHRESNETIKWDDRNRNTSLQRDIDFHRNRSDRYMGDKRLDSPQIRMECPSTPNPSFGRMECPSTPNPSFGRIECPPTPNPSFGRMECPPTPNPSFGRMDCPLTPNPSFGRMECPPTPNPSFGRMDCPSTPNPSFGRMECPSTPNPSFGRMEGSMTPSHSFGRTDPNMTPTNVFGRGDYHHNTSSFSHKYKNMKSQDPRLNRSSEYDKYQGRNDERNQLHFDDDSNMFDNANRYRSQVKSYEQDSRNNRERMSRRESSVGRSLSRDYGSEEYSSKDYGNKDYQFHRDKYKCTDDINRRNHRARSIGRINQCDDTFSTRRDREVAKHREGSIEKLISVKSHSGRSFNIDTSFNRTFQETKSPLLNASFDARRQRSSSVGRTLRESHRENAKRSSTKQNKFSFDIPDCKKMQFRRACSVGRDLNDYYTQKNFHDIKEDLRSYKFNNYDFGDRDKKETRIKLSNEKVSSNEYYSRDTRNRDNHVTNKSFLNSSELQINRDPRRRVQDNDLNVNKIDDSSKYSPRKNFRDPRMRREIDIKITSKDKYRDKDRNASSSRYKNHGIVYSSDNIAKGTILASAAGVKNFKIPKIKRPVEEIDTDNSKQTGAVVKKKDDNVDDYKSKKMDSKPTRLDSRSADKPSGIDVNKDISPKVVKSKPNEDITTSNKVTNKSKNQAENKDLVNSILDSCERRITRSVIRGGSQNIQISENSPIKKLRRIKKPLVYDSDSDSQEKELNIDNDKNIDVSKNLQNIEDKEKYKQDLDAGNEKYVQKCSNLEQADEPKDVELMKSMDDNHSINKNKLVITSEPSEEQNDSLDISFGIDDELFSDNIASGSVIDNINALIADLDHDIEAPKINDFNEKFIKNIVGSISSSNSSIQLDGDENNFASEVALNDKLDFVDDVQNIIPCNSSKSDFISGNDDEIKIAKSKMNLERENVTQSRGPEINTGKSVDNVVKNLPVQTVNEITDQENSEIQEVVKNRNTDAIVSTTANDEKTDEIRNDIQNVHNKTDTLINSFVPDSTNNCAENNIHINDKDLQQSFPDSTNELASEMNITSTLNSSELSLKEQPGASSTSTDNLPRIDSIGKLLSILEDKNKIKELLTMLDTDSGENRKIKEKLQKLSEIVLSDQDTAKEDCKDIDRQENQIGLKENVSNETDGCAEKLIQICDENKSIQNKDHVSTQNSDGEKTEFLRTIPSETLIQCSSENIEINEKNKIEDESEPHAVKSQEIVGNSNNDSQLKNNVEITKLDSKTAGECSIKEVDGNEMSQNLKSVDVAVNDDLEKIPKKHEKENLVKDAPSIAQPKSGKKCLKKTKITKRGRSRLAKKLINKDKRVTRSDAGGSQPQIPAVPKKPSRELLKLQEDIRDMFISEDILNATGIRMCRLAKLVDDKHSKGDSLTSEVEPEPIVVLENMKSKMSPDESLNSTDKTKKKAKSKTNVELSVESESKQKLKYKPGPKSKTKRQDDPYFFETESLGESNNTVDSRDRNTDSDSESVSSKSDGSSELLVEPKRKTKRKRRSWQLGVIRKKSFKNKSAAKHAEFSKSGSKDVETQDKKDKNLLKIPDYNCFTDKSYCFSKYVKNYVCRLCGYRGNDIVPHYKKHHPHSEIPLSRLSPAIAREAIEQCENMNLQAISKLQTVKHVCRFCFQEFHKQNTALETFFWHVVSVHTGEYKHLCSECINVTRCPFHLDIPPPPKNLKGQLIGYICGRCNFTQVSLENLKTHVIIRHDDEQTEVYSINLGEISRKVLRTLIIKATESSLEGHRVLRSTRSNQSITDQSDDRSDLTDSTDRIATFDTARDSPVLVSSNNVPPEIAPKNKFQSKLIFENDDMSDTSTYSKNEETIKASIKFERDDDNVDCLHNDTIDESLEIPMEPEPEPIPPPPLDAESKPVLPSLVEPVEHPDKQSELTPSTDVLDYPHFKIKLNGTGIKEYICCINGEDNHYKTTLLISFKKHIQLKHSENWDGYCFVCKVIVTGQGKHKFKDCLQHFLDKHIDNFPLLEEIRDPAIKDISESAISMPIKEVQTSKPYINVRPLSELITSDQSETSVDKTSMPKIYPVLSLGVSNDTINTQQQIEVKECKYEESLAEVMAKKHRVVLEAMLTHEKLVHVFKCAGRFCSYTTDNAEEAVLHASTHQRIGGECSLKCIYCDFDSAGNAIDLVMHVFKNYSHCSYACSKCFYRGAVSELVYAHIKRVHADLDANVVPVLSSATIAKDNTKDDMIPRDTAVSYYVCNNRDPEEGAICQFKTYVLTKFRDHMQTRHADDQEFSCYICSTIMPSSKLLAQHLKSHGLRIYQCCRCQFGADNEPELIAHASEKHPFKQPKAYLRIVTSKRGNAESRVLPLAVLSKTTGKTIVITPSSDKENPVKQAERSLDLEKLIGQTNLMIESMSTITNAATIEPIDITTNEAELQLEAEQASCSKSEVPSESMSSAVLTLLTEPENISKPSSIVKSEPIETPNVDAEKILAEIPPPINPTSVSVDSDVVCLDSDDDNVHQNIIDLSVGEVPTERNNAKKQEDGTDIRMPRSRLYKCSKCSLVSKSEGMFKRHIISCFLNPMEDIKCAFCSYTTTSSRIVIHYNDSHLEYSPYSCAICKCVLSSLGMAKRHMKFTHKETSTVVTSKTSPTGAIEYVIDSDLKERHTPKRKLSVETGNKSSEPASKLKKYGPQDVDKLPINPILDDLVYCTLCEFSTKVRLNMVRHLQLHAEQQPVPRTAPVNPVPHLESNEKHFDKMLNLASSSITNSNKTTKDGSIVLIEYLSPDAAAKYPKFIPNKHRYTCGAKDCSYISVNETMFKIHWETLHAGTNDYHCVHCPPHQHLDTSKPLTAVRIIAHLKMHDIKLYACSSCTFYHHTRKLIEKHLKEVHNGKLLIIREDGVALPSPPVTSTPSSNAPTMDLKPWQCGLCKFKSMLRPEVVEHCGNFHQSKMQFKCTYCGFRTSNIENISKHQSKQHPGKKEEVFYFYYREGSIPEEADGIARWQKQLQKSEQEIKTEIDVSPPTMSPILPKPVAPTISNIVNLDIVKKEIFESDTNVQDEESVEDLCNTFGQFCDPNGLKYKCSLCKVIIEDTKEAMQSHLYEELQYRKWKCSICSYKAFHKPGLQQHVQTEHRQNREAREPIELQVDCRIEMWVKMLLEHQTVIIENNKENLAKQKAEILRANPGSSTKVAEKPVQPSTDVAVKPNLSMEELVKLFGSLGVPNNMNYMCPKCNISTRSEAVMREHLEGELNKIRWCCNICGGTFQTYHEAQFHCRSVHPGQSSRPVEATRDVNVRAAWVNAVLSVQKLSMNYMPVNETQPVDTPVQSVDNPPENSLLVVRYEERVPTPEELMKLNKKTDTEDDKVVPGESEKKKTGDLFECKYCVATYKYESFFLVHVLKHYGLKPFSCPYCLHTDHRKMMDSHIRTEHPNRSIVFTNTQIPPNPPAHDYLKTPSSTGKSTVTEIDNKIICLVCEQQMTRLQSQSHFHDNVRPQFGMKGTVVYRCGTCLTLHKSSNDFNLHHKQYHVNEKKNSSFYKLYDENRLLYCTICNQNFGSMAQYRSHQQANHGLKPFVLHQQSDQNDVIELDNELETGGKRKADDTLILPPPKRVAKKSTTKLPTVMAVAKKSTTKLPLDAPLDDEEYSYYGTSPSMDNLENVTTLMPFCNTFVPFTLEKINEIIKIYPKVVVKDINKK